MKEFDRIELNANDDGSVTIEFYPCQKEKKSGKNNDVIGVSMYEKRKTASADNLDSAISKIKSMVNGKNPEKEMNRFFNGEDKEEE